MYKHWVFDLDGTLVDSFQPYFDALKDVLADEKIELTNEDILRARDTPLDRFMNSVLPPEKVDETSKRLVDLCISRTSQIKPFDGIIDLLEHLKDKGAELSIWTAREKPSTDKIVEHLNFERYFSRVVTRDCVIESKPSSEGLQKVMNESQKDPEKTLMIGDSVHDIMGAKDVGVDIIHAGWMEKYFKPSNIEPTHLFDCVHEFRRWAEINS